MCKPGYAECNVQVGRRTINTCFDILPSQQDVPWVVALARANVSPRKSQELAGTSGKLSSHRPTHRVNKPGLDVLPLCPLYPGD